jgi:predicted Fe-Mo cluster-binding NifX family protein
LRPEFRIVPLRAFIGTLLASAHHRKETSRTVEPQRVAIPLFDGEVAPRFCFARWMLLAEIEDGAVVDREQINVHSFGWRGRLALLSQRRVTVLICGGFNRRYLPLAEAMGIFVSWGHTGPVEPVLEKVCAGDLSLAAVPAAPDHGRGRGRGPRRGRRRVPGLQNGGGKRLGRTPVAPVNPPEEYDK